MKDTIINIKTETKTKKEAQKIAQDLGLNLSSVLNAYLKQFVSTKTVYFTLQNEKLEQPNKFLIKALIQSEKERETKKSSPIFDNTESALRWLNNKKKKI